MKSLYWDKESIESARKTCQHLWQPWRKEPGYIWRSCLNCGLRQQESFSKPGFFAAKCPACGWRGSSEDCKGGKEQANTGDIEPALCPECYQYGDESEVEEILEANAQCPITQP